MISRSQRLSAAQFNSVMEKGRVVHSPLFLLRVLKKDDEPGRFAAVAPGKVFRKAVLRSKIRRKIYESARLVPEFTSISNVNVIIFGKKPLEDAGLIESTTALKEVFVKAGLLK